MNNSKEFSEVAASPEVGLLDGLPTESLEQIARCSKSPVLLRLLMRNHAYDIQIANNRNTPPELLVELVLSDYHWQRIDDDIVNREDAPEEALRAIFSNAQSRRKIDDPKYLPDQDYTLFARKKLATHKNTPADVLSALALDEVIEIRVDIARHPTTSIETLKFLSGDEFKIVRDAVACNKNTPEKTLEMIARLEGFFDPSTYYKQSPAEKIKGILAHVFKRYAAETILTEPHENHLERDHITDNLYNKYLEYLANHKNMDIKCFKKFWKDPDCNKNVVKIMVGAKLLGREIEPYFNFFYKYYPGERNNELHANALVKALS